VLNNEVGIESMAYDLSWPEHSTPSGTEIHYNSIVGNDYGVKSVIAGSHTGKVLAEQIDATLNWWGTTNSNEILEMVSGNVNFTLWIDAPHPEGMTAEERLQEEIDGLYETIAEKVSEIVELQSDVSNLQNRIAELETIEIVDLEGQIESLGAELSDILNQIDELNAQLWNKNATIAGLRSERNELEKDLKYWKNQPPSTRIITTGGIGEDGGQMVFAVALGAVGISAMLCVKSFTTKPKSKKG